MNIPHRPVRLSRRGLLGGAAASLAALPALASGLKLNDDGLYTKPWFMESLLDLNDDLKEAADKGKRFLIMWELKGCPYCKRIHEVNLADPAIENFIKDKFELLQLNIIGARDVTDFDGERLPEKAFARKYGIRSTPTFQFFPERADGLAQKAPQAREVARWQGYMEPKPFVAMFRFVADRAYEKSSLIDYLKANS
ncbi:thioredoxin family protein [Pseudorhodoplanes sp.]|uniref:thioredoxin family protein n=1 Tax=Pseudorhodoplanes sp. TaxID=1934341 RepID=UPI00391DFF4A